MDTNKILCIGGQKNGKYIDKGILKHRDRVEFALQVPLPSPYPEMTGEVTVANTPREVYLVHMLRGEHDKFELLVEEHISADKMLRMLLNAYHQHALHDQDMLARINPRYRQAPSTASSSAE